MQPRIVNRNGAAELYLYGEIGDDGITAASVVRCLSEVGARVPLTVRINSNGGDYAQGMSIYHALCRHRGGVETYIDGICASIATVIAMAGSPITMAANASFLVHRPHVVDLSGATAHELRKRLPQLDAAGECVLDVYVNRTRGDRAELSALMDEDRWLKPVEALGYGFVDYLGPELKLAACGARFWGYPRHTEPGALPDTNRWRLAAMTRRVRGLL